MTNPNMSYMALSCLVNCHFQFSSVEVSVFAMAYRQLSAITYVFGTCLHVNHASLFCCTRTLYQRYNKVFSLMTCLQLMYHVVETYY